jgi:glycosyltransferase involved in cell wall biosynthesis
MHPVNPLFSIVLPTYNRAYVLWRAIQSVLAQTERRWELLVIDDGSTDDTPRLLEEFRDVRIRTFFTAHQGASASRNFGVRQARSAYVAYLDSDNTWRAEFLTRMLHAVRQHNDGVLWYCGQNTTIWERDGAGQWTLQRVKVDVRAQFSTAEVLRLRGPDTSCMVHVRGLLEEIGGWDEACSFLEDWDLFARCKLNYPDQVYWVPQVLVEYRQVYGIEVDGLCATSDQDPHRNRAQWRYLIEKWRGQPGFQAMAKQVADWDPEQGR